MNVPYLAHIPSEELAQNGARPAPPDREILSCVAARARALCAFVLLFLLFVVCFVLTQSIARRR